MDRSLRHRMLSRAKFHLCAWMPQKLYWYLMGEITAVTAVTSEYASLAQCMASGAEVVNVLHRLGTVTGDAVTLQIGSGLGRVEAHLCRQVKRCYGLDVSASMVRKARWLVPEKNVEFICGDGTGLTQFPAKALDLVYSFLVFQHLPRPLVHRYIGDSYGILRPDGWLVFQIMIDEAQTAPEPPARHPYGLRYWRRAEVREALERAAYEDIGSFSADGGPDPGETKGDIIFRARRPGATPRAVTQPGPDANGTGCE